MLPTSSLDELRYLRALGLSGEEERQIISTSSSPWATCHVEMLHNDPGRRCQLLQMQRRSCSWLVRIYPHGLRFSGINMSPLFGWLAGAQSVCLNMSNNDLPLQLHFALFNGSDGYVRREPSAPPLSHTPKKPHTDPLTPPSPHPSLLMCADRA